MNRNQGWSQKDQDKLVELYLDGLFVKDIAEALGKSLPATRRYIENHRERLGLPFRDPIKAALQGQKEYWEQKQHTRGPSFEKLWYGSVPRGHWMITQPWGNRHAKAA